MRCAIIDQNPDSIAQTLNCIDQIEDIKNVKVFHSALEALTMPDDDHFDFALVEVDLDFLPGIELMRTMKHIPHVIFTSTSPNKAIDAFEMQAVDFLLKPFTPQRLNRAVKLVKQRLAFNSNQIIPNSEEKNETYVWVKSEYNFVKIALDNVLYIEGLKDYLKIHLKNRPRPLLTLNSLKRIEQRLPSHRFCRIHRSFIVSVENVEEVNRNRVKIGDAMISIGENYKDHFYKNVVECGLV